MTHTLKVTVHEANHLEDVERFGKNDPYAQVSLNLKDKFIKTKTVKNAGKEAAWNQTLDLVNYNPQEHKELYVDILDEETGFDEPIAFVTIPLHQVLASPGHVTRARFNLRTVSGKEKGEILLTIAVLAPGQTEAAHPQSEVRGIVEESSEHQAHIKSLKRKESAGDAGTAALLIGAALGAKALHDASKDKAKVEREAQEKAKAENREY
ncbi:hypothetical protein BGZ97_012675 [Linnemannia gamsii]|jgi:hypothetical protein|uniref:C2 domain-containing protein n=1 Tax=Linnemannia gamsii TaxID=64522 RepID=A0A9P6RK68_9FUNG|nr:hypothetical protein BGZ97_012675 [Linnemannia gamsii]